MEEKQNEFNRYHVDNLLEIEAYYNLEKQMETLKKSIMERVLIPKNIVPYFNVGRLINVFLKNLFLINF